MSYTVEIKRPSKASYHYPNEAKAYYGRYGRDGITVHWWGGGEPASKHDAIVNYFLAQGKLGNKSVNYVVSNIKITEMVPATDVAWTSQSGNPTTISIEHQPTLSAEGYKKSGWLIWQLRVRFGKHLPLYPHSKWYPTQCPGTISLDKLEQEAQKWARGDYNPKPEKPEWEQNLKDIADKKMYTTANAPLVNVTNGSVIQRFALDTPIDVGAETTYKGTKFLMSVYSHSKHLPNAIPADQLKPKPTPEPEPTPKPQPEWETNLQDISQTKYWLTKDQQLIDITTGNPASPSKLLAKGEEFEVSAKTRARATDYGITEYSFQKKIYNGVPLSVLSVTPPAPEQPPVPPTPVNPNQGIIDDLKGIIAKLWEIIKKLGG